MSDEPFECRACGSAATAPVVSLGRTPLANALVPADRIGEPEARYPLDLVLCESCGLVQITETVPPAEMFEEYLYFSSFSTTMLDHARELATRLSEDRSLGAESLVVEAASNDGYLLQFYRERGIEVLGIDPARNIAERAEQRGIPTLARFFGRELADELVREGRRADVFHAHNVLAHVPDPRGFVGGIRALLATEGVAVVEVPYLRDLIDHLEFDTIYHEHLSYFSLQALDRLFRSEGLRIVDVARVAIHGGSLRIFARRADGAEPAPDVAKLLEEEEALGMLALPYYADFSRRIETLTGELRSFLRARRDEGKRLAVYGASAKGSTLLNVLDLPPDTFEFAVDRSTVKQGWYTPGSKLPILATEELAARMPDYTLLLTWNFKDEILSQQAEYRERGGRFVIPIPRLDVV